MAFGTRNGRHRSGSRTNTTTTTKKRTTTINQQNKAKKQRSKNKKKTCPRGSSCPFQHEYQHMLEFSHEDNNDDGVERTFRPFSGRGNLTSRTTASGTSHSSDQRLGSHSSRISSTSGRERRSILAEAAMTRIHQAHPASRRDGNADPKPKPKTIARRRGDGANGSKTDSDVPNRKRKETQPIDLTLDCKPKMAIVVDLCLESDD